MKSLLQAVRQAMHALLPRDSESDLPGHAIGIHNFLEAASDFASGEVGWRLLVGHERLKHCANLHTANHYHASKTDRKAKKAFNHADGDPSRDQINPAPSLTTPACSMHSHHAALQALVLNSTQPGLKTSRWPCTSQGAHRSSRLLGGRAQGVMHTLLARHGAPGLSHQDLARHIHAQLVQGVIHRLLPLHLLIITQATDIRPLGTPCCQVAKVQEARERRRWLSSLLADMHVPQHAATHPDSPWPQRAGDGLQHALAVPLACTSKKASLSPGAHSAFAALFSTSAFTACA